AGTVTMSVETILALFPKLAVDGFTVTSPATKRYNCIAWAAGHSDTWWWPDADPDFGVWPEGVERKPTVENFIKAYELFGFKICDDDLVEAGFEKVAIYTN